MTRRARTSLLIGAGVGVGVAAFVVWRRRQWPCPAWLAGWLESRIAATLPPPLHRLELEPGMRVLDVGSGPGRVAIPMARAVAPQGEVVALDIQQKMLDRLQTRAANAGVTNIRPLRADILQADLAPGQFDRAVLVTVLGEIPEPGRALERIAAVLKPGGMLSVTEIIGDPHYQCRQRVRHLGQAAGLEVRREFGNWLAFTMNLVKTPL